MSEEYRIINCLLVDDEPIALDIMEHHISQIDYLRVVARCGSGVEAFNIFERIPVDVVFLDIEMPGMVGTEVAKKLINRAGVVFTTAFSEYAVEGFELNAIDYLVKPISFERFLDTASKIRTWVGQKAQPTAGSSRRTEADKHESTIVLKCDGMNTRITVGDILYVESFRNCVHIHTRDKTLVSYVTISSLEERLGKDAFFRLHRSFLVSLDKIEAWSAKTVKIADQLLPVGKEQKSAFLDLMDRLS